MAIPLSHDHARKMIQLIYEKQGFDTASRSPGDDIAKELKFDVSQAPLGAMFAFVDEQIFVLKYLSHYFLSCVVEKEADAIIYRRLCDAMLSSLVSIRILSSMGLDGAARTQLRYLYEVSILWSRAIVDPEIRNQIKESSSFEDCNKFWHQNLSKRKTENFLIQRIKKEDAKWLGGYEDEDGLALDSIYERLGLSAHPSAIGMMMNTADEFSDVSDNLVARSAKFASRFVLNSAIFLTTLPFGFIPFHNYDFRCHNLFNPKEIYPSHRTAENWRNYCNELQKIIPLMFLAFIPFDQHFAKGEFPKFEGEKA